jgi:hypothetical protein
MKLTDYYKLYQSRRNTCLDENQFSSLLVMYPSVLVATSDGNFYALEKQNLAEAVKEASDGNNLITCEMYSELVFLTKAPENEMKEALSCIKDEIENRPELQTIILELMNSMAESSEGISDIEIRKIKELKDLFSIK